MFALLAGDVTLWETRHPDAEVIELADELDELIGEFKTAGCHFKRTAAGRIAAERKHVANTEGTNLLEQRTNVLFGGRDARKVRDCRRMVLLLLNREVQPRAKDAGD